MDLHDFDLEPDGIALITVYDPVHWNLSSVGGPAERDPRGLRRPGDRRQDRARDVRVARARPRAADRLVLQAAAVDGKTAVWDWFHINSIDLEPDGNLLISSRNTWAVYQIGHSFGEVLWRLGGTHSSFTLGPGRALRLAARRDARCRTARSRSSTTRTRRRSASQSRGDRRRRSTSQTHTATLLHQYVNPGQAVLSPSQGDVQQLGNGDQLIGWGQIGLVSEFSPPVR